jgi:hypothetical protein
MPQYVRNAGVWRLQTAYLLKKNPTWTSPYSHLTLSSSSLLSALLGKAASNAPASSEAIKAFQRPMKWRIEQWGKDDGAEICEEERENCKKTLISWPPL